MEQLRYISFVVALISSTSLAQTSQFSQQRRPLYFGVSGGLVSNVLVGSEVDLQKKIYNNVMSPRTGPAFSVFLKNELTPSIYLKGEAAYIRKGNNSPNNALWNLNLEYISIPLKLGFQPINYGTLSRKVQFGIEAGASFSYAPGHGTDNLSNAFSSANQGKVRKSAISALFGANLEYRFDPRRILFFNCTWFHDLTSVVSYEAGNAHYKAGNQGWIFMAGLMFPMH